MLRCEVASTRDKEAGTSIAAAVEARASVHFLAAEKKIGSEERNKESLCCCCRHEALLILLYDFHF